MNAKNKKSSVNDKELEEVNGGVMPIIFAEQSKVPTVDPVPVKPDKSEKDKLIPIPY